MKIWNGYYKMFIDLKRNKGHKATWYHGFAMGLLISLLALFIGYGVLSL